MGGRVPPTGVRTLGKEACIANSGDDVLRSQITRMTEENNVVVAEGTTHIHKKDDHALSIRFCKIFELGGGKVHRLSSFGAMLKGAA
jgi:hypothetical protein